MWPVGENRILDNGHFITEDKVILKGYVDFSDMSKIYREGAIFELPSLREIGESVLVEAMAHKLPIMALDMGLSRILNEHHCGLFVNTNQSKEGIVSEFSQNLSKLINNPDICNILGENGYRLVNTDFTWNVIMQKMYGRFIKR